MDFFFRTKTGYRLMRLMARVMPSCRDVTRLVSESMDHDLSWRKRLTIRLHVALCALCRRYERQLHLLRQGARRYGDPEAHPSAPQLSSAAKQRLKEALERRG